MQREGNMSREVTRSQRDWLEGEIAIWRSMGLVDEEKALALLGLYESRESFEARQRSRGVFTLLALAAALVGLGVLLLVGYNWAQMPAPLKVTAVFGALIGTHAAAFELRYRVGWRRISEVVFFMGCLFYGAAIWLLAQIFQIESSNYDALWWWAVGVLPFALLLDTILLHLLFAGLLALWMGFEVFSLDRLFWGVVPSSGYSVLLLVTPGLWWAYRKASATTVGIYIPLLAWWVVLQPIAWKMQANPSFFIGAVGSLMLLVSTLHPPRSEMAIPYRFYGIALVGATLVLLSFHDFNKEVVRSGTVWQGGVEQMILILSLASPALVAAYFLQMRSHGNGLQARGSLALSLRQIVARQWLPLSLLGLFALLAVLATTGQEAWVPTIVANIAMVAVALWLIRFGLAEDQTRPFGAGVIYLMLWAVLRYSDLFGSFGGMLGASLMFFLCAGVLAGVALYWRSRKAVSLG
jgi:uncharacterized membrane protein